MDARVSHFKEPAITNSFAFLFQTCLHPPHYEKKKKKKENISLKEHFNFIALALTLAGGQVFIY